MSEDILVSVQIKTLTGKKINFNELSPETSIGDVKLLIFQKEGIPPQQCRLIGDTNNCCPSQKLSTLPKNNDNVIILHMILKLGCGATPPATLLQKVLYPSIPAQYLNHILIETIELAEWNIELSKIVSSYATTFTDVVDIIPRCLRGVGRMSRNSNSEDYCVHCKQWTYDKPVIDINKMPYLQNMHTWKHSIGTFYGLDIRLVFSKYISVYDPNWTMKIDVNSLNNANITDFIQIISTNKNNIPVMLEYKLEDIGDIDDNTQFMALIINPCSVKMVSFGQKTIKAQVVIKEGIIPIVITLPSNDRGSILGQTVLEHYIFPV